MAAREEVADEVVRAELPWGTSVTARGPGVMIAFVVMAAFAGVAFIMWQHDLNDRAGIAEIKEAVSEMVYVLSLPQDKREQLQLTMPETLRGKLARRRRGASGALEE